MTPRIPEVTLLEEVGRGRGSVVYRALHRGHACTVKLPSDRPPPAADASISAFEWEVLQLARLHRVGLPKVWQLDSAGETPYAILDPTEGEPFVRVFGRTRGEVERVRLAVALAACVKQLHDAGFAHGALTPDSVLVTEGGRVVLSDRGSVTRPFPFDARGDLRALGEVLVECANRAPRPPVMGWSLLRLAQELAHGNRTDLAAVIAELESHGGLEQQRPSRFPAPSSETIATSQSPSLPRRARSEVAHLCRVWEHTAEAGGKVVEIAGAAGSGKSCLLAAFADEIAGRDVQVLSVKCSDGDWAPFSTLKRLLEGHIAGFGALAPERRAQLERNLREAAGPMGETIGLLSPQLADVFRGARGRIPSVDAQPVFALAMAEFLARYAAAAGRSVFVIDDLHWSDANSRTVLARVAARLCGQGHLFVCAARDDADHRELLERFHSTLAPDRVERLQLGPLGRDDTANLIADYLGLDVQPPRELVQQLARLSDGTPLNMLELIRVALEGGYLRPRGGVWRLAPGPVQRMRLPASSQALIERRLGLLDASVIEVLRIAAVLRGTLDVDTLAGASGIPSETVRDALETARRARLVDLDLRGRYAFVHDCVWEALQRSVSEARRREICQHAADLLYTGADGGADREYELARHYAAGIIERNPRRTFDVTWRAAQRALEACDDVLALSLLDAARRAAALIPGFEPGPPFHLALAETHLRTGANRASLEHFALALAHSHSGYERAHVLGRIAWIYHFESNPELAWQNLEAALAECGGKVPRNAPTSLGLAAGSGVLATVGLRGRKAEPQRAAVLCGLYAQCLRVSVDSGMPLRTVASALLMAAEAKQLPACRLVVQADLFMAFCFAVAGADRLSKARSARAEAMARELEDPIAQTLCHQIAHVIAGWRGDIAECERQARLCVDERGHFMELGELCLVCFGMAIIETARGRPLAALDWTTRAIARVAQHGRAPGIFTLIRDVAYATLESLGREREVARLERELRFVQYGDAVVATQTHALSYQSRAQRLIERGELGAEFEALVEGFDRLGHNPREVHLAVVVYYVQVAHARVHQCLRAGAVDRSLLLPKLKRALADLEAATRVEGLISHTSFVRAAYEWFTGSAEAAEASLVRAELLARKYGVAWVSYAVARLRAHMLRAAGDEEAALDQAKVAALWARNFAQAGRFRAIAEEFPLSDTLPEHARSELDAVRTRRHLDTLLRIGQANSRELGPERQSRLILDELLVAVGAARAFLFMRAEAEEALTVYAARTRGGRDLEADAAYDRRLVERVYATGATGQSHPGAPRGDGNCIVVALVLRERPVGVLYLDRTDGEAAFRPEDAALLQALANQVPVALELGRALRERERLEQNLRQAQKMEAIGRLAGGIAHDFNNVLAAIQFAADSLATLFVEEQDGREELDDIRDSARRGTELTRQLVTFSRDKTVTPGRIILGDVIRALLPMLRRQFQPEIEIGVDIDDTPLPVLADPTDVERVLLNLCQNASAAILDRGTIAIQVGLAHVDETLAAGAAELRAGSAYAVLTVTDTGTGMTDEVRQRLFEPFFTTKVGGTGLGLANVYAIVQRYGGHIDVQSELELGSTFRVYLPLADARPRAIDDAGADEGTILVVDDDESVRRGLVRRLERAGYHVLSAGDGERALAMLDGFDGLLDLAIVDIHLPGMNGPQLMAAVLERDPDVKSMFVSGEAPADLIRAGLLTREAAFLRKPFDETELLSHVNALVQGSHALPHDRRSH